MKASLLYRIAAVALVLFAISHTIGFTQADPRPDVNALLDTMRALHFDMLGTQRSYWELFLALGYQVSIFLLFSALLAWTLGGLTPETRAQMRLATWGFAACFAGIFVIACLYLFIVPIVFAGMVTLLLAGGAWASK